MAIVRWAPFRDLVSQDRNRVFDDAFRGNRPGAADDWALGGHWAPSVDIYEHSGDIVLNAELAGIDPNDVDVRVDNNVLTLRGQRKLEAQLKQQNYHRLERAYGSFSRSFTLPNAVDTERIKAEYTDGVLKVTLPKKEESRPKQISVSVTR